MTNNKTTTMSTFVDIMASMEPYAFGHSGSGWVRKSDLLTSYPRSMPVAYNRFASVGQCFEHHKEGSTVFVRLHPDLDWQDELNPSCAAHQWDAVSVGMRGVLEADEKVQGIIAFAEGQPDFLRTYRGTTTDLQAQLGYLSLNVRTAQRLLKKAMKGEE